MLVFENCTGLRERHNVRNVTRSLLPLGKCHTGSTADHAAPNNASIIQKQSYVVTPIEGVTAVDTGLTQAVIKL